MGCMIGNGKIARLPRAIRDVGCDGYTLSLNGCSAGGWVKTSRPVGDRDLRQGLNHENYQTNPNANFDFTQ